jgi:hypothetical protein
MATDAISIGYSAVVCFVPILLFIVIELINNIGYVKKNFGKLSIEYLYMSIMAILLFLYIRITIKKDVIYNSEIDEETQKKDLKKNVLYGMMCFYMILFTCIIYATITNNKIKAIMMFFIYGVVCLCNLAYSYERTRIYKSNDETIDFNKFMTWGVKSIPKTVNPNDPNNIYNKFNGTAIIPALVFGVVFGFIDNAGLISGLDALDKPFGYISRLVTGTLPSKNKKGGGMFSKPTDAVNARHERERVGGITSGLGNLFSDGLGVTIGAFFSKFASSIFGSDTEQPIWVDMVGISLGCILGIMIPLSFKNLTTRQMWAKGFSFRFIKDTIIILGVIGIIIATLVLLPEKARDKIEWLKD